MARAEEIIRLRDICMDYGGGLILDKLNLYILKNEFITLLGPSGCGKTTTLRIIGGFEQQTSGDILFEGKSISHLPPFARKVNTVFQHYALFSHMNVYENVAFGLRIKKLPEADITRKVGEVLELMNLPGFEKREIESLSGGQRQRVAIARAVVNEPQVLLLDEPLGALDLKLRKEMQIELKNIQKGLGITFVFVTHDQEEALTMSDTIVVMRDGLVQQIGTPIDIYNEPKNEFVAGFIGESNILDGVMRADYHVSFAGRSFECVDKGFAPDEDIDVVVRPEDIKLVPAGSGMLRGVVTSVIFKGVHYEMLVKVGEREWMLHNTLMEPVGREIGLDIYPDDIHVMKKRNP
ncbi:MAG: ABC transporter ATP-binding protein [Oscillospiraceae bacterium]|jgi:spermidine/putrescine transport system ATP-binding protein|nr:ABC transporter ATP-binding protein [Oscillospiraceae bacterium]